MYICTARWRDLTDDHLYATGDSFPHDSREIPADRVAELSGSQNKAGFALIKALDQPDEGKPAQTEETPKRARRKPKKAAE